MSRHRQSLGRGDQSPAAAAEKRVWLPYVEAGTGSDVFTRELAEWLEAEGVTVTLQRFSKIFEAAPYLLKLAPAPPGTGLTIANSWNAFAFARPGVKLIAVEHLFVLDPRYERYKTMRQKISHALLVRRFLAASYRAADLIIAPSRDTADALRQRFPEAVPHVVRHGVDVDFFRPPDTRDPPKGRPVRLAFLGARTARKGGDALAQILTLLEFDFELLLAGEPDPEFSKTPGRVRFLGRLDRHGVRRVFQESDLLLVTSRLESGPLIALEAMACGTPVVAFDVASLPEVVSDGETGRLVPLDDTAAFAAAITELTSHPRTLEGMRVASRRAAVERHSHRNMARVYRELFDQLSPTAPDADGAIRAARSRR